MCQERSASIIIVFSEESVLRSGLLSDELLYSERLKNVTVEWTKPRFFDKNLQIDTGWISEED